jgi:hypothetical protein|tara:strand:- start:92 stop:304 length:213 start_codon:yes stop_codon:yes gene_type:complete
MKIGDLVKRKLSGGRIEAGLVTDIVQKKCWRTDELGKAVDWSKIDPEPHAVVLIGEKYMTIPMADLELVS